MNPPSLNVLCLGGRHHFEHFLPVAFTIARSAQASVRLYVNNNNDADAARAPSQRLGFDLPVAVTVLQLPTWCSLLFGRLLRGRGMKIARLAIWGRRLWRGDALLVAARTSTILRKVLGAGPMLIHIPHGAGDRAKGFERRFSLFDQVIVAGDKDKARLVDMGLVAADRCHVSGSIKLATIRRVQETPPSLFDNDRRVILYCPHFDTRLSSWPTMARHVIDAIVSDSRYNLVVAPHVRLFKSVGRAQKEPWLAAQIPGRVIVDLGSERSVDMTYTRAADLYLGDISSQVYEFVADPRPCVFLNAHGVDWVGDPNYAMWAFGPVVDPGEDIVSAIDRAFRNHADFIAPQRRAAVAALGADALARPDGATAPDAIDRAAAMVANMVTARQPSGRSAR